MKLLLTVMTCPGRETALDTTLASLRASDWAAEPLVVRDEHRLPNRQLSQVTTAREVLDRAAAAEWDYLVFCEDDILVNRHLRHNLERWAPLRWGTLLVGTLYQAAHAVEVAPAVALMPCRLIGGSQAVVLSRRWLPELLARWDRLAGEGMQDLRMFRSIEPVFPYVYVHAPNLVDHQPVASTWGGPLHRSASFSPDWRA